jgi:hypothetical protein
MADPPKQKTPKGTEIPVPTRRDFYSDLDKMVKASAPGKKDKAATPPFLNDGELKIILAGQAKNGDAPFEIIDHSIKEVPAQWKE